MSSVVVLGIGNLLLSDEGIGVHAVQELVQAYLFDDAVKIIDGGTTGMELLPELEGAKDLIVIDAVRMGLPPASVARWQGEQVSAFFKTKLSPHQVGLSDILAALVLLGSSPRRIVLIGVEPFTLSLGEELSPAVKARLDEVVHLVLSELEACGHPAHLRS